MQLIKDIHGKSDERKVYLFHDGANIHKNDEVKKLMMELQIEPVLNVSWHFMFNPCERLIGQLK